MNLPYITEFFNDEFIQSLDGSSYLNESMPAILPSLQIASKTYEAKLAIERQSLYDMQTVLNQTKTDTLTYESCLITFTMCFLIFIPEIKHLMFSIFTIGFWSWLPVVEC